MTRTFVRLLALSAPLSLLLFAAGSRRADATSPAPRAAQTTSDIILTLVGGGSVEGYKPDEADLSLGGSQGLAVSARGDIFVSDANHNQVLKFDPTTGASEVVAGNGARAYGGDGLAAASASLNPPAALTFDAAGNLLVADRGNFVVRRVDAASGVISTIAGVGLFTGQVVGISPPAALGDGGAAVAASFGNIGGLAIDAAGAVIVCDSGNSCVRKFTVGGTIATIAGTPGSSGFGGDGAVGGALTAKFNAPTGVAIDGAGVVFIADSGNRRVRRLALDATVTTVAGSGAGGNAGFTGDGTPATTAQIGSLGGIALDASGRLVISCVGANRVRRVDVGAATPMITTIAGNAGVDVLGDKGPATAASFSAPRDVVFDSRGDVFVLDSGHGRSRRIDAPTGFVDTAIGAGLLGFIGDRGPKQAGVLFGPTGAAYDAAGNLYVADAFDNAVRRVAPDGTITTFAGAGTPNGLGDGGPAASASLSEPRDVCVVGGVLFIADNGNDRIRAVDLVAGQIRTYALISSPVAIVANAAGVLFVAHDDQVDTVDLVGNVAPFAGNNPVDNGANPLGNGLPAANATLSAPGGLALDAAGELFIADTGNNRIRKIGAAPGLLVSTVAGGGNPAFSSIGDGGAATSASLNAPVGVAVDATRILVADTGNHRIRAISGGNIATICGNGSAGIVGDGDLSINAQVNAPGHLFFDGADLVIVDTGNNRVREMASAIDIDPKLLTLSAKLDFAVDKKTGLLTRGKDTVSVKASLALPAGVAAANLAVHVDVVDLHQATRFDASGKQPPAAKPAAVPTTTPSFDFTPPAPPPPVVDKFTFPLKGVSVDGGKPVAFTFTGAGTLREQLGRAGFIDVTTDKSGQSLPVRINITLGRLVFTGVAATNYKATQGKGGAATTVKPK